ncbi:MAG: MCE family protein [Fibromonadales bacterium]|nr:MCE family protein [Fibromonadales bacterium]
MFRYKAIGSITIAAALLLILYLFFAVWKNENGANNVILVRFDEMGALQNQNIVSIRGFVVGHVASIVRVDEKALVKIVLDEPRIFRTDTRFRNVSPNIMGSRSIAVELGKKGEIAPSGYIFDGEFESGLAEILYMTDIAKKNVASLMEIVRLLSTGDKDNKSLQKTYEEIMEECEEFIVTLAKVVNSVEKQTLGALDKVNYYVDEVADASIKIGNSLDTLRVQAQDGVKLIEDMVLKIKAAVENLNDILIQFENSPVTIALVDKREIVDDIENLRATLQAFISTIDDQGIKIYDENGKRQSMVRLKNIHLIRETARSKAKKRSGEE